MLANGLHRWRWLQECLAITISLLPTGIASAEYSEKYSVSNTGSSANYMKLCDINNTDQDPQPELLFGRQLASNVLHFDRLVLVDGATGAIDWSYTASIYVYTGAEGNTSWEPDAWHSGPRLLDVDSDGLAEIVFVESSGNGPWIPHVYEFPTSTDATQIPMQVDSKISLDLAVSGPNPFNPSIDVNLLSAKSQRAKVLIVNARGEIVRVLLDEAVSPSQRAITWDGADSLGRQLPSGVYFVVAQADGVEVSRKIVRVK
jgi:hypothetical protein